MVTNKNINISIIQHPYTTWSTLLANLENIKCKKGFSISNEKKFWNSIPNMQLPPPFVACWLPILAHTTCCPRDKWGQKLLSSFSLGPWKKCLKERAKGRQWAHTPSHSAQRSQDVLHILISWASFSRHMLWGEQSSVLGLRITDVGRSGYSGKGTALGRCGRRVSRAAEMAQE